MEGPALGVFDSGLEVRRPFRDYLFRSGSVSNGAFTKPPSLIPCSLRAQKYLDIGSSKTLTVIEARLWGLLPYFLSSNTLVY